MSKREKKQIVNNPLSPPKRSRTGVAAAAGKPSVRGAKAVPKHAPRIAANGYRLPDPLPSGEVLTDSVKKLWVVGDVIGCGGFGEIYLAKPVEDKFTDSWHYVIKVDHNTGPLFAEINFYLRVAKEDSIRNWMRTKSECVSSCLFVLSSVNGLELLAHIRWPR